MVALEQPRMGPAENSGQEHQRCQAGHRHDGRHKGSDGDIRHQRRHKQRRETQGDHNAIAGNGAGRLLENLFGGRCKAPRFFIKATQALDEVDGKVYGQSQRECRQHGDRHVVILADPTDHAVHAHNGRTQRHHSQ